MFLFRSQQQPTTATTSERKAGSGKGKGGRAKGQRKGVSVSSSKRAGLTFPVGRIGRYLRKGGYASRVSATAPVYLAAVLEYLTAELMELAGASATQHKRQRIIPRDILLAVRGDEELNKLLGHATFASGGVEPKIHLALLPCLTEGGHKSYAKNKKNCRHGEPVARPPSKKKKSAAAKKSSGKKSSAGKKKKASGKKKAAVKKDTKKLVKAAAKAVKSPTTKAAKTVSKAAAKVEKDLGKKSS